MKILQIVWLSGIGGLEKYLLQLAEELRDKGHRLEVCVLHKTGFLTEELAKKKIIYSVINIRNGFDFVGAIRLRKFLKKAQYDIIHVHDRNYLSNLIIQLSGNVPKVFTEHGGELVGKTPFKRKLFYKLFSRGFSKIIANSEYIKKNILKNNLAEESKVVTVYNGINLIDFPVSNSRRDVIKKRIGIDENKKVIGIIGRMVEAKGIDLFLEAAKELSKSKKELSFLIIGDGPKRNEYEKLASSCFKGLEIRFLGWVREINELLDIFDIFLFTSRWEPFGMVLLEAMIKGVPIVGFDIPGSNEVVLNGKTAIFVQPFDIKKLAKAVLEVLSDNDLYISIKRESQQRVKELFTIQRNVSFVEEIYKQCRQDYSASQV